MTRKIGKIVILEAEPSQQCDLCGKVAELRPYGPNGECICYECGMKDEETTERMIRQVLFGDGNNKFITVTSDHISGVYWPVVVKDETEIDRKASWRLYDDAELIARRWAKELGIEYKDERAYDKRRPPRYPRKEVRRMAKTLRERGWTIEKIRAWRQKAFDEGHPSNLRDFYEANNIHPECVGRGCFLCNFTGEWVEPKEVKSNEA